MRYPTQSVGDATLVTSLIVKKAFLRLVGVVGHNNSGADVYVQVHETAAVPADGQVPKFSVLAFAGLPYSFSLPAPVDMDACTIVVSSTLATKTAVAGTPATIQALIAA